MAATALHPAVARPTAHCSARETDGRAAAVRVLARRDFQRSITTTHVHTDSFGQAGSGLGRQGIAVSVGLSSVPTCSRGGGGGGGESSGCGGDFQRRIAMRSSGSGNSGFSGDGNGNLASVEHGRIHRRWKLRHRSFGFTVARDDGVHAIRAAADDDGATAPAPGSFGSLGDVMAGLKAELFPTATASGASPSPAGASGKSATTFAAAMAVLVLILNPEPKVPTLNIKPWNRWDHKR